MKNVLIIQVFFCLAPALCLANGGGYAYGVRQTGTVTPFEPRGIKSVQIVDEKLDILLTPGGARVTVRYAMKNVADKKVTVTFGFPVERVTDPDSEPKKKSKTPPKHFRNYNVKLDGRAVKSAYRTERYGRTGRGKPSIVKLLRGIEGWMVSTISFDPGQRRQLLIRYASAYDQRGFSVSDDDQREASIFRYRFSTGAVWHGPIAEGRVRVRALGIHLPWVKIKRPVNRFKKRADAWTWSFSDLEPTLADDLEIHAQPAVYLYAVYDKEPGRSTYYTWNRKQFYLAHLDYRVKASSELPGQTGNRHPAANLKGPRKDPWCEGVEGAGIGQAIEIVPNKKLPLFALLIDPGHLRSEKLFTLNNRPAALEIVLNDSHRFTARLADEPLEHLIVVGRYRKQVRKIKIVIKKVYKGRSWDDTCIARVTLVSKLSSPPKHYGAR
jgi:hypothetical protein